MVLLFLAAIADALTNIGNFAALALIPGGIFLAFTEALLFIATASLQFYIGHEIMPKLFSDIAEGRLFQNFTIDKVKYSDFFKKNPVRKVVFIVGIVISAAVGISMAALTFQYSLDVFSSLGLANAELAVGLAAVMAMATVIFFRVCRSTPSVLCWFVLVFGRISKTISQAFIPIERGKVGSPER